MLAPLALAGHTAQAHKLKVARTPYLPWWQAYSKVFNGSYGGFNNFISMKYFVIIFGAMVINNLALLIRRFYQAWFLGFIYKHNQILYYMIWASVVSNDLNWVFFMPFSYNGVY